MTKLVGSIIIVFTFYFIGKSVVNYKLSNLNTQQDLIRFFRIVKEQLTSNYNDITNTIITGCEKCDFVMKNDFIIFAQMIQASDSDTFTSAFENYKDKYSQNSCEIINEFAKKLDENGLMYADRAIDEMIVILNEKYENAKVKAYSDNKLTISFAVFMGLFVVIVLI